MGSLAELTEAAGAKVRRQEGGEVISITVDGREIRLLVGLPRAETADRVVELSFPTLDVSEGLTICDAEAVARLLKGEEQP